MKKMQRRGKLDPSSKGKAGDPGKNNKLGGIKRCFQDLHFDCSILFWSRRLLSLVRRCREWRRQLRGQLTRHNGQQLQLHRPKGSSFTLLLWTAAAAAIKLGISCCGSSCCRRRRRLQCKSHRQIVPHARRILHPYMKRRRWSKQHL